MDDSDTNIRDQDRSDSLFSEQDPIELFCDWLADAEASEPLNPGAMSLATVDEHGNPNVRMVLLKTADHEGFVFYSNTESQKAIELKTTSKAALCFYWKSLRRQVRLQGSVAPVSNAEADAYFATRPKDAQIGAWASKQSRVLAGRFELEAEVAKYAAKYAFKPVDRPPFWSGYRLRPTIIEFWHERKFRLHDRRIFSRPDIDLPKWTVERLYP